MPGADKTTYANCLGRFVLDKNGKLIDTKLFNVDEAIKFLHDTGDEKKVPAPETLEVFRDEKFFKQFREVNILLAKQKIKESFSRDQLIIQVVAVVEDLDKVANGLVKRLRDWYALQAPEVTHSIESNEKFVKIILDSGKDILLKELKVGQAEAMGAEISTKDSGQVQALAEQVNTVYDIRDHYNSYLESLMKEICPNVYAITGTMIGAKLVAIAGGLEKLSQFPASTVQLLGAEKALFRHLKTGAKPPKFGVLINHPLITKSKKAEKGKVARALADKVSIASKVDYFKGEFIGEQLRKDLEKRFDQ
ncbi:NOP5/NOP56 family protein [Thermoproteota archaeon]